MRFQRKTLVVALAMIGAAPFAAHAADGSTEKLERIEVVGSNIKKIQKEGPSPIQVIKRADIEKTGASTVAQLLQNLPSNSGSFSDQASGSQFAAGTSSVSIHGMGSDNTLVLLNGRRMANYGFAQGGSIGFVDLNTLPLGAVERVEVLKDGASAIYGSDAIGGVVNIITRKNYNGIEGSVRTGQASHGDGTEYSTSLTAGFGDLDTDKFNVLVALNTYDAKAINARDRDVSKSADHRGQRNGSNFNSSYGPIGSYYDEANDTYRVARSCPAGSTTICKYDPNQVLQLQNKTERRGVMAIGNYKFSDDLSAFAELGINRNTTWTQAAPTPVSPTPKHMSYVIPAGVGGNPTGAPVEILWRLTDAGNRQDKIVSDTYRIITGLRGHLGEWDWESAFNYSRNEATSNGSNYISASGLTDALKSGALSPFYATQNQAAINAVKLNTTHKSVSTLASVDLKFSNAELFKLSSGSVGAAFGLEYRRETIDDKPDDNSAIGNIVGSGGTSSNASRKVNAAYVEVNIPVSKTLELQLAERYDNYNDFGGAFNPKVALRWQPITSLLVRGSYSTAFRAPSLVQSYTGGTVGFSSLQDTPYCKANNIAVCEEMQYPSVSGGNPQLKPETSYNTSWGVVFEPVKWASMSLDVYRINKYNVIDSNTQFVVNHPEVYGDKVVRGPDGKMTMVYSPYLNLGREVVRGIDTGLTLRGDLGAMGSLTWTTEGNYLIADQVQSYPGEPLKDQAGLYGNPKWRADTSVTWDTSSFSTLARINYVGGFRDETLEKKPNTKVVDNVPSYTTLDLQVLYKGVKNLKITGGINNVFNKEPPYANLGESYGFATNLYSARGRFYYVNVGYKFK